MCHRAAKTLVSVCLIAFGSLSASAARKTIRLPPPRPLDLGVPSPAKPATPPSKIEPSAADNHVLRAQVLASGHVIGHDLASIADHGGCGIAAPLQLDAILLPDGAKVTLVPPVIMRASLAAALADWLRQDLAPAVAIKGDELTKIEGVGAYECRSRDGVAGAKLSEHATGDALDLRAFATKHGKLLVIAPQTDADAYREQAILAVMKASACARFTTVLGPGSDSYHAQHLHIDLEARRYGTHLCQWILPHVARDMKKQE